VSRVLAVRWPNDQLAADGAWCEDEPPEKK
jgi:hypothetical protein